MKEWTKVAIAWTIFSAADCGFELPEVCGRRSCGLSEKPAEIEGVFETKIGRHLFDGLPSVQHLPFGLPHDALADQFREGLVQMEPDESRKRLRGDVQHGCVISGCMMNAEMFLNQVPELSQSLGIWPCEMWAAFCC